MDNERLLRAIERIAIAQEQLVVVAMEARQERIKTAKALTDRLKAGFMQEHSDGQETK